MSHVEAPSAVYAIADAEALWPRGLAEGAEIMAFSGIRTIQLRAKKLGDSSLFREAEECLRRLDGWEGSIWIDDRVDLAGLLPFSGVHLGQSDLLPSVTRRILSESCSIGQSTHNAEQWRAAQADVAVDWIAIGPIRLTTSKADPDPVVGFAELSRLATLAKAAGAQRKPLIAIGGLDADTLPEALASGADSVALLRAVCEGDIRANCRRLLQAAGE